MGPVHSDARLENKSSTKASSTSCPRPVHFFWRADRTPYGVDLIFEAVLVRFKGRQRCGALVELSDETRWRRGYGGSED